MIMSRKMKDQGEMHMFNMGGRGTGTDSASDGLSIKDILKNKQNEMPPELRMIKN